MKCLVGFDSDENPQGDSISIFLALLCLYFYKKYNLIAYEMCGGI